MERSPITAFFMYVVIVVSGLLLFYLLAPVNYLTYFFLPLVALVTVIGVIFLIWALHSTPETLKRKINKILKIIFYESLEVLKVHYLDILNLYLKLSDRHKPKFYPKIVDIKEKLESHFQTEKNVRTLLHQAEGKALADLKQIYDKLYPEFSKLPHKVQGQYYAHLVHLRQKMEKGQ